MGDTDSFTFGGTWEEDGAAIKAGWEETATIFTIS